MKKTILLLILLLPLLLIVALMLNMSNQHSGTAEPPQQSFLRLLSGADDGYAKVYAARPFIFPQDHGAHERYRTEWWYFTGNVQDQAGRLFGYELTFFRLAMQAETLQSASSWRSEQMYMAHFAITDVESERFYSDERFSRSGNALAGASKQGFHVWLYDWFAKADGLDNQQLHLKAENQNIGIDLQLKSSKKRLLQGDRGYSKKSALPGNASYYYSQPRMKTSGTLNIQGELFKVTGLSWMDREWSSSSLGKEQSGWDWFALQLSNGSEFMYYQLRRKDGVKDVHSSGVIYEYDHQQISLPHDAVTITVLDHWRSANGALYPSLWHISVPEQALELDITPLLNNQLLDVSYQYWEGAVRVHGTKKGKPITGQGYVELTGY